MTITVHFRVDPQLHKLIRSRSVLSGEKTGLYYNLAMNLFTRQAQTGHTQDDKRITFESARVENIDEDIYAQFKVACYKQNIKISTGIYLALKTWLDSNKQVVFEVWGQTFAQQS